MAENTTKIGHNEIIRELGGGGIGAENRPALR